MDNAYLSSLMHNRAGGIPPVSASATPSAPPSGSPASGLPGMHHGPSHLPPSHPWGLPGGPSTGLPGLPPSAAPLGATAAPAGAFSAMFPPMSPASAAMAAHQAMMMDSMHQRMAAESHHRLALHAAQVAEVERMAHVQRTLENSRREAAAAQALASSKAPVSSSLTSPSMAPPRPAPTTPTSSSSFLSPRPASPQAHRETLFSHGLSPLDRGGLYPSHHGGILDPLSSPSIPAPSRIPTSASPATSRPSSSLSVNKFEESPGSSGFNPFDPRPSSSQEKKPNPSDIPFRPFQEPSPSMPRPSSTHSMFGPPPSTLPSALPSGLPPGLASPHTPWQAGISPLAAPQPQRSFKPFRPGEDTEDEEDAEVHVNKFDNGQCSRTSPLNHPKLKQFREKRDKERRIKKQNFHYPPQDTKPAIPAPREDYGPPPTKIPKKDPSVPPTSGNIPVGIAIGRQRSQPDAPSRPAGSSKDKTGPTAGASCSSSLSSPSGAGFSPLPGSHLQGSPGSSGMRWPHPGSMGAAPPGAWPHHMPPGTPGPSPSPFGAPSWMPSMPPPSGPIPMGYQLAKDPLTGQILLIPTEGNAPPGAGPGAWPQPPPSPAPFDSSPSHFTSLGPPPPTPPPSGSASAAHFHHMYMQQQQQMYFQQQQAAAHHAAYRAEHARSELLRPPMKRPNGGGPPETITVSDDDDEAPAPTAAKKMALAPERERETPSTSKEHSSATSISSSDIKEERQLDKLRESASSHSSLSQPRAKSPERAENVASQAEKGKFEMTNPTTASSAEVRPKEEIAKSAIGSANEDKVDGLSEPNLQPKVEALALNEPSTARPDSKGPETGGLGVAQIKSEPIAEIEEEKEKEEEEEVSLPIPDSQDPIPKPLSDEDKLDNAKVIESAPASTEIDTDNVKIEPETEPETEPEVRDSVIYSDNEKDVAGALVTMSEKDVDFVPPRLFNPSQRAKKFGYGFDLLFSAIEKAEVSDRYREVPEDGIELLCQVTNNDSKTYGIKDNYMDKSLLDMRLLCAVTTNDYMDTFLRFDPMVNLRKKFALHDYSSPAAEKKCKEVIANKIANHRNAPSLASLLTAINQAVENAVYSGAIPDDRFALTIQYYNAVQTGEDDYKGIKSLAKVIKKIRDTEIMSQLEVELRASIVQIQETYRDKQKELTRLKTLTPKKGSSAKDFCPGSAKKDLSQMVTGSPMSSSSRRSKRGPGRPKKRKLTSKGKNKMGRPRKNRDGKREEKTEKNIRTSTETEDQAEEEDEEDNVNVEDEDEEEDLSPPILEPSVQTVAPLKIKDLQNRRKSSVDSGRSTPSSDKVKRARSLDKSESESGSEQKLLKPPKLTPSTGTNSTVNRGPGVTNLSTISARFMMGRTNPFANLLKLATKPSGPSAQSKSASEEDDSEDEDEAAKSDDERSTTTNNTGSRRNSQESISESEAETEIKKEIKEEIKSESEEEVEQKEEVEISKIEEKSTNKKRKSEPKKKNTAESTETIVPKKPRNLFMMNCLNLQREFKSTSAAASSTNVVKDEYDFNEDDEDELPEVKKGSTFSNPASAASAKGAAGKKGIYSEFRDAKQAISSNGSATKEAGSKKAISSSSTSSSQSQSPLLVGGGGKEKEKETKEKDGKEKETKTWRQSTQPSAAKQTKSSSAGISPKSSSNVASSNASKSPSTSIAKSGKERKPSAPQTKTNSVAQNSSSSTAGVAKSSNKGQHSKTSTVAPLPRTATLQISDLKDGLRFLLLDNGKFHPARLNSTDFDGIFNVALVKQRHNRPEIMARDDILTKGILEITPESKAQICAGTRVCVFWSQAYNHHLFPATVEHQEENSYYNKADMVEVLLDDGDRRPVELSNVRMLPPNYDIVVPEPDPLDTRKRRVSNDSSEAGDHQHRLASLTTPTQSRRALSPSPLTNSVATSSPAKKGSKVVKKRAPPTTRKRNNTPQKVKKSVETIEEEDEDSSSNSDDSNSDSDDNAGEENLRIKLDGSFNNTTTYSIRSPMYQASRTTSEESNHGNGSSEEEDSDDSRSEASSESEDETDGKRKGQHRVGINPVTGRPLWTWSDGDEGYKRRGTGKGKGKKVFHRAIRRRSSRDNSEANSGEEVISVGDCAVFLSTAVDRPYIGKVEQFWETWNGGKMVKVKWFYHPEEIETSGKKVVDLKVQGGLFLSPHTDENDVQTISHKCTVLPIKEYTRSMTLDKKTKKATPPANTYYLAGSYDPTAMSVNFQQGVSKQ